MAPTGLLDLPDELLMNILCVVSTPSFVQAITTCTKLYSIAADSRDVILHHLHALPGIKLGLDDFTVRTEDLFLLLRQRASRFLYGAHFTADCTEFGYRNAVLDADASCMADVGTEYTTISAVIKDSLHIRLYGSRCDLKDHIDSPYADGEAKVLQVVHRRFTISILYQWKEGLGSFDPKIDTSIPHITVAEKLKLSGAEEPADQEESPKIRYHLLHYNAYTKEKPFFFAINQHEGLVPTFLAVQSRLHCAIVWDKEGYGHSPSDYTKIVLYTASKCPYNEEGTYDDQVVWPTVRDPRPILASKTLIARGEAPRRVKRIAFHKDGRRLRLYAPGEIVPWHVIVTNSAYDHQAQLNMVGFSKGITFHVDTPFYGQHETYTDLGDEIHAFCNMSYLCLGVAQVSRASSCKILCILKSKMRYDHDDCRHMVDLGRMAHINADDCAIVARLWGWQELASSMTGLEAVAISKLGTRIAIAMWNRVLVWALDPRILCEDVQDLESDEEELKSKKRKRKAKVKRKGVADDFYARKYYPTLGWRLAEVKPVVLDLQGAIARKMAWSVNEDTDDSDDSEDDDDEARTITSVGVSDDEGEGSRSAISTTAVENIAAPGAKPQAVTNCTTEESILMCAPDPPSDGPQDDHGSLPTTPLHHLGEQNDNEKVDLPVETPIPKPVRLNFHQPDPAQSSDVSPPRSSQDPVQDPLRSHLEHPTDLKHNSDHSKLATTRLIPLPSVSSTAPDTSTGVSVLINAPSDPKSQGREELEVHITDNIGRPVTVASSSSPLLSTDSAAVEKSPPMSSTKIEDELPMTSTTAATGTAPESNCLDLTMINTNVSTTMKRHRKRHTEDELVIMTDRGIQVWDLGPRGTGKRKKEWLAERLD